MDFQSFLLGLAFIFPAYVANATPVVAIRILGRAHPLDMGFVFIDGRRVLGDGKTFEGLLTGLGAGTATGILIHLISPSFISIYDSFIMSFGALAGDVLGAFIKRRLGIASGGPAPILDQLGFLVVALFLVNSLSGLPEWMDRETVILLMGFTVFMHVGTNTVAYLLHLKDRWY